MLITRLAYLGFGLLVGCAAARERDADRPRGSSEGALTVAAAPDLAKLKERLAKEPLRGLVIASERALFFPTAEAARAAARPLLATATPPSKSDGFALRVLEDLGDVVRVATEPGASDVSRLDERFDLQLFVRRDALLPVLSAPRAVGYDDGTSYLVREGVVVSLDDVEPRLAPVLLAALPIRLGPDDVALSFTEVEPPGVELDMRRLGAQLGCKWESGGGGGHTRIGPRRVLAEAIGREHRIAQGEAESLAWDNAWIPDDAYPCELVDSRREDPGATNARLSIGGHELGTASRAPDGCGTSTVAWKDATSDEVVVSFRMRRAQLSVRTKASALTASPSCGGSIGIGALDSEKEKGLFVEARRPVYFPDGSPAGSHIGKRTKLPRPEEVGGRWCIRLGNLAVPVCLDKGAVKELGP